MAQAMQHPPPVEALIRRLDVAVQETCPQRCTGGVKRVLEEIVGRGEAFLSAASIEPHPDRYARRLLHRDPDGRYTVVVMTWGAGQQTPVHDHAGLWCVECVYQGTIEVTSFSLLGDPDGDRFKFRPETAVRAVLGDAGALIPPFEYHRIANAAAATAVTIHVYGGDMDWGHRFDPDDDGTWIRTRCRLSFDG